jgi:hypothetical protein
MQGSLDHGHVKVTVNEWRRGADLKPMYAKGPLFSQQWHVSSGRHDAGIALSRALNIHFLYQASFGFDAAHWCCSLPQWWS